MTLKKHAIVLAAAVSIAAFQSLSLASEAKQLLDVSAADVAQRVAPKNDQATITASADAQSPGVVVAVQPGKDPYPGVVLAPASGGTFDLSEYGHVDVKITNTSSKPLGAILQVENAGNWRNAPWNAEQQVIKPGATGTVTVIFGYGYGKKLGYSLKTAEISKIQLMVFKPAEAQSFRIESITAGGAKGEKPPVDPNSVRVRPTDGMVLGAGAHLISSEKQIEAVGGAKAALNGDTLQFEFVPGTANQSILLKPAIGRWDLGFATQLRVRIKNTGATAITPSVQLTSDKTNLTAAIESTEPIAVGQSQDIVVPFAAGKTWIGMPSASIFKGDVSGGTGPNFQAGTGTTYASDRTDGIKITAKHDGAASLAIESITAEAPPADVPQWLGKRPPVEGEWVKTFDDDFNGPAVNLTKWNNEGPNYWDKISHWSKQNLIFDGKTVSLHYEKKTGFNNDNPNEKQTDYTGAYLDTFDKWRQRYGYFEARMKLPTVKGLWPAFWMMPDRGPESGDKPGSKAKRCATDNKGMEFDIMEQLALWGPHRYNIAMHWDNYGPEHKAIGTGKIYAQADKDGFITAGLLWTPGAAVYYCNGQEVARWEDPRISNVPSYMIVYMPTGGWDNNDLEPAALPDDFKIDYVRCWQRKDLDAPLDPTPAVDGK